MDAESVVGFEHLNVGFVVEGDGLDIERVDSNEQIEEVSLNVDRLSNIEASLNELGHRGKNLSDQLLEELSGG